MGNNNSSNNKTTLRKSQSVPDTQRLSPDAPVFSKEKSMSQQRLNIKQGKPNKPGGKKHKHEQEELPQLPPAEAVFLPDFPLRGDLEELEFEVIDVIAKGAFGNVIKVQREDQKRFYAMKVLDKEQIIQEGAIKQCKDEAAIQSVVGEHPFIVKAYEYWQSRRFLYILLDYVPHGDMFTLWTFHGAFPETLVRLYIAEISLVIDYLHNASVIYRDVKMENILFDPEGHIQMTDFGLAKWLQGGDQTRTVCGTLQYMAPEVLSVYPYGHAADWWSVGIIMYAMLAGKYPVDGADTHTKMAQRVFECDYLLPSHISDSAQDVINRFLTKSPHKRLSDIYTIQDLHFFQDIVFSDLIDRKVNPNDIVPEDFFPMTGESWAPNVITPEEQRHFDQFDDSSETITQDEGYQHLPHYQHSQHRHSNTYRPQSIDLPQGSEAKSHLPESYRRPSLGQAMEAKSFHQGPSPLPTSYSKQISLHEDNKNDSGYSRQTSVPFSHHHSTGNIASNVNSGLYSVSGNSNSWRDQPLKSSSGYDSGDNVGSGYNTTASGGGTGNFFHQNSEASDRLRAAQNYGDTSNLPGTSGTPRNNTNSVDPNTGVPSLGQATVSRQSVTRRSISGEGLVSSNNHPINNFTTTTINPSPSLTYKTVEPPPTVTLKSPGFNNTAPPGYSRQLSGVNPTNSSVTLTVSANTAQTYNMGIQFSHSVESSVQDPAYNSRRSNVQNSGAFNTSQGYITVDAPPVITLPQQNNFNSYKPETPTGTLRTNMSSNNGLNQPYTSANNGPNQPYVSSNNYTRLEQQSISLNPLPQEKPVVPVKPVPPQKPAKPLAPIRPQPAPRRSLMGQASNTLPQTTPTGMNTPPALTSKPVFSSGFQNNSTIGQGSFNKPGFVQVKSNFSQGIQSNADHKKGIQNNNNNVPMSLTNNSSQRFHESAYPVSASLNTSISSSASFQPYQAQASFPPQSLTLPLASSDNTRSRLSSNTGQETPLKSPGSDSLKWNLPADATPSFV